MNTIPHDWGRRLIFTGVADAAGLQLLDARIGDVAILESGSTYMLAGSETQPDGWVRLSGEGASAAIAQHNESASAHASIRSAITSEATVRADADSTLQSDIDAHEANVSNPHQVDLQQVANEQATTGVVLPQGTAGIYEGAADPENKLLTRAEVQAETQGGILYKGQLKYGAMTVDDMNAITGMQTNDLCGVQATKLTYKWDGTAWQAQANGDDVTGDLYDILF